MRKRAERRASEGDTPSSTPDFKDSEKSPENSEVQNSEIDSGVASSMDEAPISKIIEEKNKANNHNSKKKNKKQGKLQKQKLQEIHNNSDLIFNLDF